MLLAVMQENAGIIDTGVEIDKHSNERNREDVDIIAGNRTALELHNKGPEIDILEYRVLERRRHGFARLRGRQKDRHGGKGNA